MEIWSLLVEVCNVRSAIPTDNQQKFAKAHEKSHEKKNFKQLDQPSTLVQASPSPGF